MYNKSEKFLLQRNTIWVLICSLAIIVFLIVLDRILIAKTGILHNSAAIMYMMPENCLQYFDEQTLNYSV